MPEPPRRGAGAELACLDRAGLLGPLQERVGQLPQPLDRLGGRRRAHDLGVGLLRQPAGHVREQVQLPDLPALRLLPYPQPESFHYPPPVLRGRTGTSRTSIRPWPAFISEVRKVPRAASSTGGGSVNLSATVIVTCNSPLPLRNGQSGASRSFNVSKRPS